MHAKAQLLKILFFLLHAQFREMLKGQLMKKKNLTPKDIMHSQNTRLKKL